VFLPWMGGPLFKLLLLGVILSVVTPYALLLAVPFYVFWLKRYRQDVRQVRRWPLLVGRLAAWTVYNLALTAVLVGSSIRSRTIVL